MRSSTAILNEIRNGDLTAEITQALADALQSVQDNPNKDAKVTITVSISQLTKKNLTEPAIGYTGEVSTKLAKADTEETIFFIDKNGDPSRSPTRQQDLGLTVAGSEQGAKQA